MASIIQPAYPPGLKAMSVHAPWAYLICQGWKEEEYRTKPTNLRGWILIHASLSKDSDNVITEDGLPRAEVEAMRGKIVGSVFVDGCYAMDGDCAGYYAYCLKQPIYFKRKDWIAVPGCQTIFWGPTTPEKEAAFAHLWPIVRDYDFARDY